jgi:hypothetical protein
MVGHHETRLWVEGGRWTVAVDGDLLPRWFATQAEAWTAAVSEIDRVHGHAAA